MSQRLLITTKELIKHDDDFYDCIYTENSNYENLLNEWCCYNFETGTYFGPFKICIRSYELMDKFCEDFKILGTYINELKSFNDIWSIYDEKEQIHISVEEDNKVKNILDSFLDHIHYQPERSKREDH